MALVAFTAGFANPFRGITGISEDDEREIGMEFDQELRGNVEVISDPVVTAFINDLGQSIVREIEPQPFIYRFRVIKNPSLNAFAVPGGYIYFHSETLLVAGDIHELAGVMGHEIAHAKAHHYARMTEKTQIPSLLTSLAGIGAAVATGEPGIAVATQAANVAVGLKFSREFEAESDQLGAIWLTRAGYDPSGITRFFERILEERDRYPNVIPPYLFSHPEVEERIATVTAQAEELTPVREPDLDLVAALPAVQERLRLLIETRRASLPHFPQNDEVTKEAATDIDVDIDAVLTEAGELSEAGHLDAALLKLARAEASGKRDPRVTFATGELLFDAGRYREAADAYLRTVAVDSSHAQVYYKLGLSQARSGERHHAVYALEHASLRVGPQTDLYHDIAWEIEKLTFVIVPESGFADGSVGVTSAAPPGRPRSEFTTAAPRIVWWARIGDHFSDRRDDISIRWIAPDGRIVREGPAESGTGPYVTATLEFSSDIESTPGRWVLEARTRRDVVSRATVEIQR